VTFFAPAGFAGPDIGSWSGAVVGAGVGYYLSKKF
jgi:hypothetical protein